MNQSTKRLLELECFRTKHRYMKYRKMRDLYKAPNDGETLTITYDDVIYTLLRHVDHKLERLCCCDAADRGAAAGRSP